MRRPLVRASLALFVLAASLASADLKLTVVVRIQSDAVPDLVPSSLKNDPKTAAQFRKDLAEDPQTALTMGQPVTIVEWFSNGRERLDMGPATFVTTHSPDRTVGLDRKGRTYRTMPADPSEKAARAVDAKIRDTGRTRTIAGHLTHEFSIATRGADGKPLTMRMWAAPDLPNAFSAADPLLSQMPSEQRSAFARVKGAVLRFEMAVPTGGKRPTLFSEQVVAISSEPIPASAFETPSGYTKYAP